MVISYYFDAPVHRAIKVGLQMRGVDVLTAQEDGKSSAIDQIIMNRSVELNRPLVTTDHDFLVLAKIFNQKKTSFPGLFFMSSKVNIGYAVEELAFYATAGEAEDFVNQVIFL